MSERELISSKMNYIHDQVCGQETWEPLMTRLHGIIRADECSLSCQFRTNFPRMHRSVNTISLHVQTSRKPSSTVRFFSEFTDFSAS
ncbi:hypothetical protein PEC301296_07760 [Pectobacterium carotovorum subsp. carotovorum]|nr:hypothetical protein GZ59_31340 [Pectobacterium atrosepticum]POW31514.1 hypothetical protein PB72LOC_00941 [Pectobacterium atrosepticum]GKV84464.1 hypothetical protein PEC301296_07760 [Pectobacterium carotovorum subsp. carotovorum]